MQVHWHIFFSATVEASQHQHLLQGSFSLWSYKPYSLVSGPLAQSPHPPFQLRNKIFRAPVTHPSTKHGLRPSSTGTALGPASAKSPSIGSPEPAV